MTIIKGEKKKRIPDDILAPTDKGGRVQFLPSVADWIQFNADNFSYAAGDKITVSGIDATEYFQVGDKLKIIQTTEKFFYIYKVTSSYLMISGGDDYTLADAVIGYLAISRVSNPTGHPVFFNWTATITPFTGSVSNVTQNFYFEMRKNVLYIYGTLKCDLSTQTYTIDISYPFVIEPPDDVRRLNYLASYNAAAEDIADIVGISIVTPDEDYYDVFTIDRTDGLQMSPRTGNDIFYIADISTRIDSN